VSRHLTRRDVLRLGAAAGALSALPGCDAACDSAWGWLGPRVDPLPDAISLAASTEVDPVFHLLSRAAYGPRPGDVERVGARGTEAWIEEQLHPGDIDDTPLAFRLAECELIFDDAHELRSVEERHLRHQMERATVLRAAHTRRQLQEVMTGFWTDHFSIDAGKRGCRQTKPRDEREVIRAHALGTFRDLIRASALSPAMLIYLDGRENRSRTPDEAPNENYARELLELHTLGVHGGYSQTDVMEAARCLTGWTLEEDSFGKALKLESYATRDAVFRMNAHDNGEKTVLGHVIPEGGGKQDLDDLLDLVCTHPSTARHIAEKLCRRLVAETPPDSIVTSTAAEFTRSNGDIKALVRHILSSEEFAASAGAKVKRPLRFVVSALRAVGAEVRAGRGELGALERMGHVPYSHPTPDGYPDEAAPWMGTMLWRWNFALALGTNTLGATKIDLAGLVKRAGLDAETASPAELAPLFLGRIATATEQSAIDAYAAGGEGRTAKEEAIALLVASPAFQVH
jgi:hypothetical protein